MLEQNAMACNRFYQLVRDFSVRCKPWKTAIRYDTKPDEVNDITLVAYRVYGDRNEFFAVMAAVGMNSVEEPLAEQTITLPTKAQLIEFKKRAGYENDHRKRQFLRVLNDAAE